MTAPTVVSQTPTTFTSDTTSHNANYPVTTTAGRLLLILACFDGSSTIATPTGYGAGAIDSVGQGGDPPLAVFGKIADGTEGGTTVDVVTSNNQAGGVNILEISGHKGAVSDILHRADTLEQGYNQILFPSGIPPHNLDWLYLQAFGRAATTAWESVPSGWTGLTATTSPGVSVGTVGGRYLAISNIFASALYGIPGHGTSSTVMRTVTLMIPQAFAGTISGTVTLGGSPVSGANVYAMNQTTKEIWGPATSDGSGDYSIAVPSTSDLYHVFFEYEDAPDLYNALSLWDVEPV